MMSLYLALSAAFLCGISAMPWSVVMDDRPQAEELSTGQMIFLPLPHGTVFLHRSGERDNFSERVEFPEAVGRWMGGQQKEERSDGDGLRSRRSTQPRSEGGQQGGNNSQRGGVEVDVSRGPGGGRRVEARGEGNVWQSRDGRGRVDVHGHYSRDFGGRQGTGRPQYGGGVRYSHRF